MKNCNICKQEKPKNNYGTYKKDGRIFLRSGCNECRAKKAQEYRDKNPEKLREIARRSYQKNKARRFEDRIKKLYNITLDDYNRMLEEQNHSCKICGRTEPTGRGWHVDHCHTEGDVRGILCSHCNTGLGMFQDNPEIFLKAIEYLNGKAKYP